MAAWKCSQLASEAAAPAGNGALPLPRSVRFNALITERTLDRLRMPFALWTRAAVCAELNSIQHPHHIEGRTEEAYAAARTPRSATPNMPSGCCAAAPLMAASRRAVLHSRWFGPLARPRFLYQSL
jgi:hypothetical protein